ncbi:MAG: tetratricopeptide repeat protein [Blastocatellia bacterium]
MASAQTNDLNERFARAMALQRSGQFTEAEAEYRQIIAQAPNYAEAQANLGAVLAQLGRLKEAVTSYETALALNPALKPIWLNLGIAHYRAAQFAQAATALENFLAVAPTHLQARQLLGTALVEVGRDADAIPHLEAALQAAPEELTCLYSLGLAYLHQSKPALAGLIERLQKQPAGQALAQLLQGQFLLSQTKYKEANAAFLAAAKSNEQLPRLQYWLGLSYYMLDEKKAALACLQKEMQQTPDDVATLLQLAQLEMELLYFDQAKQHTEAALRSEPSNVRAQKLLGTTLYKQGQANAALPVWEALAKQTPDDAEAHYYLGQIYKRLGRAKEAAEHGERSEQLRAAQKAGVKP